MNPHWQVSFKGKLTGDAMAELAQAGIAIRAVDGSHNLTVWVRAADGTDAIAKAKAALAPHGTFSEFNAEPVNWTMYLGFPESEGPAIEAAVAEVAAQDPRVMGVVLSEPAKGSAELLLEIPAATQAEAADQARVIYADLRSRAHLPPAEALYGFLGRTGTFPSVPIQAPARWAELARRARQLVDDGSYDYAVVAAQTACEVLAFDAITDLPKSSGGSALPFANAWFQKHSRTPSLVEDWQRDLWNALAGDEIQRTTWWSAYRDHLVRRHGVVHRGYEPTKPEAESSLQASKDFIAHVTKKIQDMLEKGEQ